MKVSGKEVPIKRLTFGGVVKLRDAIKGIDFAVVESLFNAKGSDELSITQFGIKIIRTIGLDSPEIILGLLQAFTDLNNEEISNLEPAGCIGIITEGIETNADVIRELSDSLKNLFSLSKKAEKK